jgi:hypothetical protein
MSELGASHLKPRASAKVQLVLAGLVWYAAAAILAWRAASWLIGADNALLLAAIGIVFGLLKVRFIMDPVAARAVDRIHARGREECAGGFFAWQSWLIVIVMMVAGHALRLTAIPRPWLGALYVTISTGLLLAGRRYWIAATDKGE